ncbi:MAG: hypothetical protein AAF383_10725, partial [Cyanobacteria bacterium P01_A01_bin.83]
MFLISLVALLEEISLSILGSNAIGSAGNISITAGSFTLSDGGFLTSSTFGQGKAGDVTVNVDGAVNLINDAQIFSTVGSNAVLEGEDRSTVSINADSLSIDGVSSIETASSGQGDAGDIEIRTSSLTFLGGRSFIESSTFGQGDAGNVVLNINDTVEIKGGNIFSTVEAGGQGNGGNIEIQAQSFSLTEGGNLQTLVRSSDGTLPGGEGNAGNITLNVDTVNISGQNSGNISSQITSQTRSNTKGNAGNIFIDANSLTLSDNGLIDSSTFGEGNGGTITINADELALENQGQISAQTDFPQSDGITPSEINLFIDNTLTLKGNSTISAEAFNSANGGNITINAGDGFVVAFPSEGVGNDIRANASEGGNGGVINISAQQIFGLEEARGTARLENNSNDIDASSDDGTLDGDIVINTSDVNLIRGATELPSSIIEPNRSVTQACSNSNNSRTASSFVIDGKGGIPPLPDAPLDSEIITINGATANSSQGYAIPTSVGDIIPARGVIKKADGSITLTATPVAGSSSRVPNGVDCG